ncbi:MAG: hypothetical protein CL927_14925 [Deltaproteobacteria bacterium]|nr:hypothetical protein [Deltaproteobacteria bacterium]HCH64961.1 hypothetical protein [Deltaproteobacteria bacterium]
MSTDSRDSQAVIRPRWRRRLLLAGAGLLCTLGPVVWFGRSDLLSDTVAHRLGPLVRELAGFDLVLGRAEILPLRGQARLEGLALTHFVPDDPVIHGAPVLSVGAVEAELGWHNRRPGLGRLEIWRPSVHLRVGPDGIRELAGIEMDANAERFPWEALLIHDGRLVVEGPEWVVQTTGVNIKPATGSRNDLKIDTVDVRVREFRQVVRDVHIPDVVLAPGRVAVPELDLRADVLDLAAGISLDHGNLDGHFDLSVRLADLAPLTLPKARLDGTVRLTGEVHGTTQNPDLEGRLEVADLFVDRLRPDGVRIDNWFGDIEADVRLKERLFTASPVRAGWSGGQVTLHAALDLDDKGLALSGKARSLQLVDLLKNLSAAPTPWVALDMDLDFDLAGTAQPLRLDGPVEAVARHLRVGSAPIEQPDTSLVLAIDEGRALAQLSLIGTSLDVDIHRFTASQGVEAKVAINAELVAPPKLDIRADIRRFPLAVLRPLGGSDLQGVARGQAHLWGAAGAFQAESELSVDGLGVLGFPLADHVSGLLHSPEMKTLQFSKLDALLGRTHYTGDIDVLLGRDPLGLDIDIEIHEGSLADLTGIVLDIPGLDADLAGTAKIAGPWNRTNGAYALELSAVDLFGEPFDRGLARAVMTDGELFIDELSVSRDEDRSGIVARGRMGRNFALNVDIHAGGIDLQESALVQSSGARLNGALTADVHVAGTAFEPLPSGRLDIRDFTIGKRSLGAATVGFETAGTLLSFHGDGFGRGVRVEGDLALDRTAAWEFDADLRNFDLAPLLPEPVNGGNYIAQVTGQFTANGEYDTPANLDMELQNVELAWGRHRLLAPEPWRFAVADRMFSVDGVRLEGGKTRVMVDARQNESGIITLDGSGEIDLDLLRTVIPGLTRSAGTAVFNVEAEGVGAGFMPEVAIQIEEGLFEGSWFPHAFEGVSATIQATPAAFTLADAAGRLGGGTFTLGGRVDAKNWFPTRVDLTTDVDNARVRYLDFLPAAVGDAQLTFGGPIDGLLLSGDIQIEDMVFAERIDWESWVLEFSGEHLSGSVSEDTEEYFNLDLAVTGENTIRFRNNVGDFVVSSDFQFMGNTSRPGLTGRLQVTPGGRVLLKEREFEINRGELRFTDPYSFDPDVDIDMRTEVSTREQDYDINYAVTGPYSDWRTSTRSEPALPQADINALLLFGLTMEEMERYGGAVSALAVEGGDLLASKLGIVERVGQGVVGLDTFRPERIDLVSGVSERGSGSVSSDLRLLVEKDLEWATLIFEQNLSRSIDTYLGLERRLARMFYVRTYWAREQVGRRLDIGGAYGVEAKIRGELD